ncbi:hypothetical protein QUA81_22685 [Microcoleus sp. F6_B4]
MFKILIRDGVSIDLLGSGEMMPLTVLGKYVYVDKELFMWYMTWVRSHFKKLDSPLSENAEKKKGDRYYLACLPKGDRLLKPKHFSNQWQ